MTKKIAIFVAFLTGLGMIFIGARFFIAPETAEAGYGLHFNQNSDYSFHYIKGIRDVFAGLLICIFVLGKQTRALGLTLLLGTIIPLVDMLIVLSKSYTTITQAVPHISAVIICFTCGLILVLSRKKQKVGATGFAEIIQTAEGDKKSVIKFNIIPQEKTPWHYHTLFSETFEVLEGTLEVGRNKEVIQLKKGDKVTIAPNERHYFNNVSNMDCLVRVSVSPGNKNFEKALLISKGLAKDGFAGVSGVPKKLSDLALFIKLNNSRMVGPQKIAEPFFGYLAKRAVKKGRLKELEATYCNG